MNDAIQIGKKAPQVTSAIFDPSPMPNQISDRGTSAITGIDRKPCSTGSVMCCSTRTRAVSRPAATPEHRGEREAGHRALQADQDVASQLTRDDQRKQRIDHRGRRRKHQDVDVRHDPGQDLPGQQEEDDAQEVERDEGDEPGAFPATQLRDEGAFHCRGIERGARPAFGILLHWTVRSRSWSACGECSAAVMRA